MRYLLSENVALRSWLKVPHAYYLKGQRFAKYLDEDEYERLCRCDGQEDVPDDDLQRSLVEKGLCRPASDGETLTAWQKPLVCENRLFLRAFWSITERCGYHCPYCYNGAIVDSAADGGAGHGREADELAWEECRDAPEFTWEECLDLIEQAAACGINCFKLTGGEPLMHPRFLDIIREIYRRGMYVEALYTTGELLTAEILDEMERIGCRPVIKISFDGIGAHDWFHGKTGAEKRAREAIELCSAYGFPVEVVTNLNKRNVGVLLPSALMLDGMGVGALQVMPTLRPQRFRTSADAYLLSPEEYFDALLDFTDGYLKTDCRMKAELWGFALLDPTGVSRAAKGARAGFRDSKPVCGSVRGMVGISADGELVPCLMMTGLLRRTGISYGNVKRQPLKELLTEGPYVQEACFSRREYLQANEECAECERYPECLSGCPTAALAMMGDMHKKNPLDCCCHREGYREKMDAVLARNAASRNL